MSMEFEAKLIEAAGLTPEQIAQLMAIHQTAGTGADQIIDRLEGAIAEIDQPMLTDVVRAISVFYVSAMKDIILRQLGIEQKMSAQQLDGFLALNTYMIARHAIHVDQEVDKEVDEDDAE